VADQEDSRPAPAWKVDRTPRSRFLTLALSLAIVVLLIARRFLLIAENQPGEKKADEPDRLLTPPLIKCEGYLVTDV
jgi:hypothetical protein